MNRLSTAKRATILQMLVEGSSLRSISRITGASINTVTKLLVDAGNACAEFHDTHVVDVRSRRIQVDEMWAFVYAKQKHVEGSSKAPAGAGDAWTWTALDADSKLIVTWAVGSRGLETAHPFMQDLANRLRGRVQLTSDGHGPYIAAVEDAFGADVDFAQLIKLYGTEQTETRYSPAKCLGVKVREITGDPDPKHVNTSYIERQNLNVRMGVRRFTRLTNAFSKKLANHAHAVALFYVWYNWCRRHTTTRTTPAQAAGLTDTWYDAEWLVGVVEAHLPKPAKPGPKLRRDR
ncbi:MAG: IS1 family transposase [Acidobacteria bacterium]|nr:IS1 family transposase [Acidobacteriota bacterium]